MKSLASIVALFAVTAAFAQGEQTTRPAVNMSEKIFDPARDSAKDIADAIKLATKQNKHILLDVGGNWCIWCHRLDTLFKSNKDVAGMLKQYVVVKVNWSKENENKEVLTNYPKISGFPHIFVLDKTGKLVQSQDTGLLETGDHHDPEKVMTFLKKWAK
ncbi:MAG: thioredoxin family protein [Armatimonadota bacterium]